MAKSKQTLIKMVSTAESGYFYVTTKNPKKTTEKLTLKKYDASKQQVTCRLRARLFAHACRSSRHRA